ncbi:MAG: hypothetical protein LBL23_09145 [Coriobacteriales bacterium]|jgi:predicted nuclease of predicted toxin-antitoxin system|nr:hypothetical protein [Coriobacteriales bacterium]
MSDLLPDALIDHCLGTSRIPELFRSKGFKTTTVFDEFGREDALDLEILELAGRKQLLFVTKDSNIRKNRIEREAVFQNNVRLLCLVHQNMRFSNMAAVFTKHMRGIVRYSQRPGPWFVIVSESQLKDITEEMRKRRGEA